MEHKQITFKSINRNPDAFYRWTYPVMRMAKDELVNLDLLYPKQKIVIVDSAGWYYREQFKSVDIYCVEGICMCKNVSLDRSKFDKLYDDTEYHDIKFPNLSNPGCVLFFDHSPVLKYRTGPQIKEIFDRLSSNVEPTKIHLRLPLLTTDDNRFKDRLIEMSGIVPDGYVTAKFNFDMNLKHPMLVAEFYKKSNYAKNFN